ncbi:MAG: cadherin repeat domain-containing protein, partial [Planctomycetes bacterium]|nr:cadherin repeat domain-containing protein [Planctomycetota bacterium]
GVNNPTLLVDYAPPTVTISPSVTGTATVAYGYHTGVIGIKGTNFSTLLSAGENSTTDIKERLDWTKLVWDINGDSANGSSTASDMTFALSDITSAKVLSDTQIAITLINDKMTALESKGNFGSSGGADTIDISAGFARDAAGNVSTNDAVTNAKMEAILGEAFINLGNITVGGKTYRYGQLMAPVQVDGGNWFYYWDASGDGSATSAGDDRVVWNATAWPSDNNTVYMPKLDLEFKYASDFTTINPSAAPSADYRYATINGIKVAVPLAGAGGANYNAGGTSVGNATSAAAGSNAVNPNYDGLIAVWDAYNGTTSSGNGTPTGWSGSNYVTATPYGAGTHVMVGIGAGSLSLLGDNSSYAGALQVFNTNNSAPVMSGAATATVTENATIGTVVYTATATDQDAVGSMVYTLSGTDQGVFTLNSTTGALSLNYSLDYENPIDSGVRDNVYNITITASDGLYTSAAKAVAITVNNVLPSVSGIAITGQTNATSSGSGSSTVYTLNTGDVITVKVTMSEATTVSTAGGIPTLNLNIGGTAVQARYAYSSSTTELIFTYTVVAGLNDTNGISVDANSLSLNGGTLTEGSGARNATLTHTVVAVD